MLAWCTLDFINGEGFYDKKRNDNEDKKRNSRLYTDEGVDGGLGVRRGSSL